MSLDGIADTRLATDADLIADCRNGDESAWEQIVSRNQRLLFSIPRRAGLSVDQASDVLQEVFTTLFEKLDKLEKPEFLRAWLVSTTRFKTMHYLAREHRGRHKSIDDDTDAVFDLTDPGALPDQVMVTLERAEQISLAFAGLEPKCLRLLTMLYVEEPPIPYSEISEELGVPIGSIGPTRARCLEKLLKMIPDGM